MISEGVVVLCRSQPLVVMRTRLVCVRGTLVVGDGVQTVFSLHSSESRDSISFVLQGNVVVVGETLRLRCLGLLFYQNSAYPNGCDNSKIALRLRALHCAASDYSIKRSLPTSLAC